MKNLILFLVLSIFMISCSETNSPSGNNVTLSSGINQTNLHATIYKNADEIASKEYADSLTVTDFKMLISRVKFHGGKTSSDDTLFDDSKSLNFVSGAFVVHSDTSNMNFVFANASLNAGTYNKIKVEMHRLNSNDFDMYSDKPYFADFVTNDRNTIAIRGKYYQNGVATDFVYFANIVLNYTFNLVPPVEIGESGDYRFEFAFNPALLFKDDSGNILIPDMEDHKSKLEKNMKNAMKLLKK